MEEIDTPGDELSVPATPGGVQDDIVPSTPAMPSTAEGGQASQPSTSVQQCMAATEGEESKPATEEKETAAEAGK
eukprot:7188745-Lingulodinium_polyedra.AAC.1